MSENPLELGMVYVVAKLTLCYVFQRVLFFVVYEGVKTKKSLLLQAAMEDESVVAPRDGLEPPTQ